MEETAMGNTTTESANAQSAGLDLLKPDAALAALFRGQADAVAAVRPALPDIARAASVAADTLRIGGRLVYAAAGSSGLMAFADALELPGTFGIARDRIKVLFAGGAPSLETFVGGPEDDAALGVRDVEKADIAAEDCVIAVSASGSTPYTVGALGHGAKRGARTVAMANNAGSPLLALAETAILLPTPPELVAGSTRMGAGTAQKVALNMLSTLMAIALGHVVDGHMVNLVADNTKLEERAARMVATLAHCDRQTALDCLARANGSAKVAILLAAGVPDKDSAAQLLEDQSRNLRSALTAIDQGTDPEKQRA